jgi:hypothetical protein
MDTILEEQALKTPTEPELIFKEEAEEGDFYGQFEPQPDTLQQ